MPDLACVAVTIAFFALCAAYVQLCARIVGEDPPVTVAGVPDRGGDEAPMAEPVP